MQTGTDEVFKALADSTRRLLLDRLYARPGLTLTELCSDIEMSRQAVSKHLTILEGANLVAAHRAGREKLHYLNPVPVQAIHDRWIGKYTSKHARALTALKEQLEGRQQ
jgi:DNA-binding transcriptional ArsR family regulator